MPADANIFQAYLRPPKSIMEYQDEADQAQSRRNALQMAAMDLSDKTQANQGRAAVRNALQRLAPDATDDQRIASLRGTGTQEGLAAADALQKTLIEQQKSASEVKKNDATTGHLGAQTADQVYKTRMAKSDQAIKDISAFNSPQEALASLQAHVAAGDVDPQKAQMIQQSIPQNPADFPKWQLGMLKNIMAAKDQLALTVPDANATLQAQTSTSNNAATNATSRANNRDTIAGENMRSGVNADGSVSPDVEAQAQAIAKGQLMPPSGAALINPKNAKVLARVMEINPNYDATAVLAKKKAAADFTTGSQGNSMRSFAVAGQHLDQLGTLVDALDNGNMQLVNKVGNLYSQQTGSPAVTNFDAAKDVVSKEVVKAIVAGGGGVAEREELSKLMDNAKSPAQLKGVIKQYRNLMAAQHDALLQQRDAAGISRSTLPNYTDANGSAQAPTVPPDIAAILDKHGKK